MVFILVLRHSISWRYGMSGGYGLTGMDVEWAPQVSCVGVDVQYLFGVGLPLSISF